MAALAGLGASRGSVPWLLCGTISAVAVNFLCGILFFALVTENSLAVAFAAAVLPFIPNAVLQIVVLAVINKATQNIKRYIL